MRRLSHIALAFVLVFASSAQAADQLTREQVVDTLASINGPYGGWQCQGGDTCRKLLTARTTFARKGADLFVQSDFPLGLHRMVQLNRAVIISTGEYSWDPWKAQLQVEYFVNSDAFPMVAQCNVNSIKSIACRVLVAAPVTPEAPAGYLVDDIQWVRLGSN